MNGENNSETSETDNLQERFTKEFRVKKCEDLMRPEVRALIHLPLDEKVAKAKEIIKEALEKYGSVGIGFSGGTDSLILLHLALPMISEKNPIIFVNTGHQFQETYNFIE